MCITAPVICVDELVYNMLMKQRKQFVDRVVFCLLLLLHRILTCDLATAAVQSSSHKHRLRENAKTSSADCLQRAVNRYMMCFARVCGGTRGVRAAIAKLDIELALTSRCDPHKKPVSLVMKSNTNPTHKADLEVNPSKQRARAKCH